MPGIVVWAEYEPYLHSRALINPGPTNPDIAQGRVGASPSGIPPLNWQQFGNTPGGKYRTKWETLGPVVPSDQARQYKPGWVRSSWDAGNPPLKVETRVRTPLGLRVNAQVRRHVRIDRRVNGAVRPAFVPRSTWTRQVRGAPATACALDVCRRSGAVWSVVGPTKGGSGERARRCDRDTFAVR